MSITKHQILVLLQKYSHFSHKPKPLRYTTKLATINLY